MLDLTGVTTALITPFNGDNKVDTRALAGLVEAQLAAGVHGLLACGTTGETPTLTDDEYALVVRTVVEAAGGRAPVLAGTGTNCTRTTIERTRKAGELGADAALVVAPYYNKPQQRGMVRHFSDVAREGGLPVVVYNVPSRTGINIEPRTSITLAAVDGIVAVKEASGSVEAVKTIAEAVATDFTVLSGDDAKSLEFYKVGARGVISVASNVAPGLVVKLWDLWKAGELDGAAALDRSLAPLFEALFVEPNPVPCKAAAMMLGICKDTVRLPLVQASSETRDLMAGVLEKLHLV
ncbi:MAG: 4-hydroxy-tetrahydrodipicolinate synthase [Deltaproteobacteria bacterium]|nr:4-hydroxy-tetrahydrodipicolinate synthase [Deltaproteobacteria bacterium]